MVRVLTLLTVTVSLASPTLFGQCVQFDVPTMLVAHEVTSDELRAHMDEKLIRIQIPISSLVRLESESSLAQFLYLISGTTTHSFQVVDYAPKTTLVTDVEGLVSEEKSEDHSSGFGITASAPREFPVKADASAKYSDSNRASRRLDRLPPKQLLSASGTMHRGLSAYFKLKPSTQTTLEGDKTFEIVARVNDGWRAGLLAVNCAAFGRRGGYGDSSKNLVCGRRGFVVGVYMEGDEVAKQSVETLASTQRQLQQLAREHAQFIEERRFPSVGHKLGAAFSVVKPRIPEQWLMTLLTSGDLHSFEKHLPRPVRAAATDYRQARTEVIGFAG